MSVSVIGKNNRRKGYLRLWPHLYINVSNKVFPLWVKKHRFLRGGRKSLEVVPYIVCIKCYMQTDSLKITQPVFCVSDNTRIQILNIVYSLPFALTDVLSRIKLITKCLFCLTVGNFRLLEVNRF